MASITGGTRRVTTVGTEAVLHPGTMDELRDVMRDAMTTQTPLRIGGAGTWHHSGAPVQASRTVSLTQMQGILAYVPGDLTITAFAGTTLAELSHATAAHGQWLGLDPAGERAGTIGATIATASAGPLAHAFGTPRDLVLGLEAVTGYGDVVKPGGRVVKNVAGFDLVRLFTGSWGTLGPITAVTLRLRALPVHDVTLAMPVDVGDDCTALVAALRQPVISLLACEWICARTAAALGLNDGRDHFLLRLGGNEAFVRGQRARLDAIRTCTPVEPTVWGALALLDDDAAAVVRVSGAVSTWPARIARVRAALPAAADAVVHSSMCRGIARIIVRGDAVAARALLQARDTGERRIVERLPDAWWDTEPDAFGSALSARIREAFDPSLICNRRRVPDA